jgi:G6PDH family F420-dependent oxidoreductase
MQLGLKLFAEGYAPLDLARHAVLAEQAGFDFVEISDHFHPWLDDPQDGPIQGHSGFAWSVLGMVAAQTSRIHLGTGVTCPTMRYHPAIIAQAAATMAILSKGRFFLGLGSGERLNEHIVGNGWRSAPVRQDMLEEAVQIIRLLWSGGFHSFTGQHLRLEDARVYDLPETLPLIIIAAGGAKAAQIAASRGDGMFLTSPRAGLVETYRCAGNPGPIIAEMLVSFASSKQAGLEAAARAFRWSALGEATDAEIPRASLFKQSTQVIGAADLAQIVTAGHVPDDYLQRASEYSKAGATAISLINSGPDMGAFLEFAGEHLVEPIHRLEPSAASGLTVKARPTNAR